MRTSRKRSLRRSTSSRSKRATGTPRTMQGPLVPGEPRGFSDGNGGRAVQLANGGDATSGVEPERVVRSSGSGPCSCPMSFKSGNRHVITGRSLPTEEERNPPIVSIRGLSGKDTKTVERRRVHRQRIVTARTRSPLCNTLQVSLKGRKTGTAEVRRRNPHGSEASRALDRSLWETPRMRPPAHRSATPTVVCRIQTDFPMISCDRVDTQEHSPVVSSTEQTCTTASKARLRRRVHPRRGNTGSGWTGRGSLTVTEICDGPPLASPGRWAVDDRRYPEDPIWSEVAKRYMAYSEKVGTPELLTSLALGKISSCPFRPGEIDELKHGVINFLQIKGSRSGLEVAGSGSPIAVSSSRPRHRDLRHRHTAVDIRRPRRQNLPTLMHQDVQLRPGKPLQPCEEAGLSSLMAHLRPHWSPVLLLCCLRLLLWSKSMD